VSEPAVKPLAVPPGEGLAVSSPTSGTLTFKVMSGESGGAVTAAEAASPAGQGPPLHVHPEQDEVISTLEGTFRVKLGDELVEAPPGSMVFIPRGTPHTWQNVGGTPGRFIFTLTPAAPNFERFFQLYAELPAEERGVEAFTRLSRETQAMDVVGPPLAESDPA
jgi:quercetin dioxygenase-like cupin family protein